MSNDPTQLIDTTEIREGDILFDCPHCGKNLAIEAAGAGLMVPCVGCGKPVQVPIPDAATPEAPIAPVPRPVTVDGEDPLETIRQLDEALAMANQQIDHLRAEKEALQERRAFLEQVRVTGSVRLERVVAEIATIQDALDRTLVLLAEIRAEKPA